MPFKFNFDLDKILGLKRIRKTDIKRNLFVEFGLWLKHFIIKNKNTFIGIGVGILIILIAIPFYLRSNYKKTDEANRYFESALGLYRQAMFGKDLSNEERVDLIQKSLGAFQFVIDNYKSTPLAADALFYQANIYYDLNDYNSALKKYEEYVDKYPGRYFADFALINVGKCYEQLNNFGEAVKAYEKVIKKYRKRQSVPEAIFNLGKLYELNNNINEAFKYYNQLIQQYPYSPWAREARTRILFIQALFSSQTKK